MRLSNGIGYDIMEIVDMLLGTTSCCILTPDTEPSVIAARHRELIGDAVREHGVDVDKISEVVVLPVSIVRRHLCDMGLMDVVEKKRTTTVSLLANAVIECLKSSSEPMTPQAIRTKTGADYDAIYRILSRSDRFEQIVIGKAGIRTRHAWRLKEDCH